MELHRHRVSTSVRTEGGLLPSDLLAKIAAVDRDVPGLSEDDYGLESGDRVREAITRSWNRLVGAWAALGAARVAATNDREPLTSPTRERWLLPLFDELGFGRLATARAIDIEGTSYPISHGWGDRVPIHLVGFGIELDRRTPGVRGAAGAAPHALVQEYLNRSDAALWGIVSNGRLLRLLRDSTSLTRQAFVEFDLESIFEGELYADFALLWSVCHRTRFEGAKPDECLLEHWSKKAADDGTRALDQLRGGVEKAIETFGAGFLAHPSNGALREALRSGELNRQDYYRELLRLVYRLIFLFTAEDRRDETTGRELLLDPTVSDEAAERYRRFYSTARLRGIAGRRRGTRHPDLWVSLRRVIAAIGGGGAPTLAIPALGSFLFGPSACSHLDGADLRNEDLLDAVRALATIEEDRRLRLVDYRNLGAEELGGIYESLLELHPLIEIEATPPRFKLATVAGNERRTTGSYYTQTSLIGCLLDSVLDPALDEAARSANPEAAILALAVVDPASGSGHFLVAAAHRIARRLASIRSGEGEPPPAIVRAALRAVISHCIYAVDLNPMAVELCKVGLWLEALEPGKPLSFLDARIKTGNSLVGATPELIAAGIPDAAFDPLKGDNSATARSLRDRNAQERVGQLGFGDLADQLDASRLISAWTHFQELDESSSEQIRAKEISYQRLLDSPDVRRQRAAADIWCAAFLTRKTPMSTPITTSTLRAAALDPASVPPAITRAMDEALPEAGAMHWFLEFPDVMARGGFDVVIGNPPWETLSPDAKEFFAAYDPGVRNASPATQKAIIAHLLEDPAVQIAWDEYCDRLYRLAQYLRNSGRYRLFAPGNLGKGDFNVYRIFIELALELTKPDGRAAQIVPDGLYLGANATAIRREMVDNWRLRRIFGFENAREVWFKDIDSRTRFCIYAARKGGNTSSFEIAFGLKSEGDLRRALAEGGVSLGAEMLRGLSPETYAIPDAADLRVLTLVERIGRRWPRFGDEHAGWPERHYMRELDMGNDRDRFNDREGYPLYEGRMVDQFDHRAKAYVSGRGRTAVWRDLAFSDPDKAVRPQWFVSSSAVPSNARARMTQYRLGFCDVTSPTNERTLVAALLPPSVICGHKVPTILLDGGGPADYMFWLGFANSLVVDFVARRKVSLSMSYTVLDGLALPRKVGMDEASREVVEIAARLTCASEDMLGFWDVLASDGWVPTRVPGVLPGLINEEERAAARAQIDALVAVDFFGFATSDIEVVLADFKALGNRERRQYRELRTARLVLAAVQSRLEAHGGSAANEAASFVRPVDIVASRPTPATEYPKPAPTARWAAERPARVAGGGEQTLLPTVRGDGTDGTWLSETAIDPREILMGTKVRHRARGLGTVLTVRPSGRSAELLIRFDVGGEAWIAFGYGVLEFAGDTDESGSE
jgi:hypothetical protein